VPIKAVCFDVGETLIDETRHWIEWAEFLGVPPLTLFTAIGVIMERGQSLRRIFEIFKPELDPPRARKMRALEGWTYDFVPQDLYPDAIPSLSALREAGYKVLVAGNQPVESEAALARLGVPADLIASSGGWGIAKPDAAFFTKVADAAGEAPEDIAYVGDRLDNDVLPARAAGMRAIFIRRGPWGWLHADKPDITQAHLRVTSLLELPEQLPRL
jgi:FMN phosphatase YigB (HAD superfamily)